MKVGNIVKGISDKYATTNKKMKKAIVTKVSGEDITVKILEHEENIKGVFAIDKDSVEIIGEVKPFDRESVLELLRNGCKKAILDYNLCGADLRDADLRDANLCGADLDYSCFPLWCGGLHIVADKRLACQLAYHLCSMQCDDEEYIQMRNSILDFANQFHRAGECGKLEVLEGNDKLIEKN